MSILEKAALKQIGNLSVFVTPQMYGAKGDGVTDDSQAIISAFTSGAKWVHIPVGTYLINITAGTDHTNRDFCMANVPKVTGIKGKSIIKLGSGNCNEVNYRGFEALFKWTGADVDVLVDGVTFDFNPTQNTVTHYTGQYVGVENNSQNFALLGGYIRDFTVRNCEVIGHHGTNAIGYFVNTSNTKDSHVVIEHNKFSNIGQAAKYNGLDAYHDHSTIGVHNGDTAGYNYKVVATIHDNDFYGVGGNAYNAVECGADVQYFYNNTIDHYFISNLILCARKNVVAKNYDNVATNLAQGFGIFTYTSETNTPDADAFKLIELKNNLYNIDIDSHKSIPNWSSYTLSGSYYRHFYVGGLWGASHRNIDTLTFDNNTIEFNQSSDVTSITTDTYAGCGLGLAPFASSDISAFTSVPVLRKLNLTNNTFKNCYKEALHYATYPNTTNILIKDNKVYNCCFDTSGSFSVFNIELVGNQSGFPYAVNSILHAYNESVVCEKNYVFDTIANYILSFSIWENSISVPVSIFKYKDNITNIPLTSSPYTLGGVASSTAVKNADTFVKNLVANCNFASGTTNWTANNTTNAITSNQLKITEDTTTNEHYASQTISTSPIASHIYYVRANVYQNGGQVVIYNKKSDNTFEQTSSAVVTSTGMCSALLTVSSVYATPNMFIRLYGKTGSYLGTSASYFFNNVMVVDLTATYGAGKEPTQAWCDANITINSITT